MINNYWFNICLDILSEYTLRPSFDAPSSTIFNRIHHHIDSAVDFALSSNDKSNICDEIEQLLWWNGISGFKMGQHDYALEHLLKCHDVATRLYGEADKQCLDICRYISQIYIHLEKNEEARHWLSESHVEGLCYHADLGALYSYAQQWDNALDECTKALSLCANSFDRGIISNNIAYIYLAGKQDLLSASKHIQPALPLLDDDNVADEEKMKILNTLTGICAKKGDCNFVLQVYETMLVIRKRLLGDIHPDVARIYQNIGGVYDMMGDKKLTLKYWEKAAMMFIEASGKDNIHTRQCVTNICNYLLFNGTEQEYESMLRRLGYRE